ncbi:MAG: DsbA family protein [Holosporaceae bacterium]|jgi:protein-disulfide isomerase|nr:DsbA family protein [Holosporaceae bacterium]
MGYDIFSKICAALWLLGLGVSCFSHQEFIHADAYFEEKTKENADKSKDTLESSFAKRLKQLPIPGSFALDEVVIGDRNAPVTLIIYTSFTCNHCRKFHLEELPIFMEKYVLTGKVKIYLRSYLQDVGSLESSMLVRCFGEESEEKILEMYDKLFGSQEEWLQSKNPRQFLKDFFKNLTPNQTYGDAEIDACIGNANISAGLMLEEKRALHDLAIVQVPAFVANGNVRQGFLTVEELEKFLKLDAQRLEGDTPQ